MYSMDLDEMVEKIETREDLVNFLEALLVDLKENPSDWENDTLGRFLNGMWGWLQAMNGWCKNNNIPVPDQPSWWLVGQMLLSAKYYE